MMFEIETPQGRFQVDAPDMQAAIKALGGGSQQPAAAAINPRERALATLAKPASEREVPSEMAMRSPLGNMPQGRMQSFGQGFSDTGGMGFADEAAAGIGSLLTGNDYGDVLKEMRDINKGAHEQNPGSYLGGQVTGAIAPAAASGGAGLAARPGAALLGRMGTGAASGAAYGGVYGFGSGEGDIGDRLPDAIGGAAGGALIGGAIPAFATAGKALAKPITDAISARMNPSGFAAQKIEERLAAGKVTPGVVANKMANSPGLSVADVAGKSARDLLRTTVNIPGPARDRVATQVALRQLGQGDRLKTAIGQTLADPDGYLTAKDQLASMAKRIAAPLYDRAYARPVHFSQTLEDVLTTPAGQAALSKAQQLAANEQQPFKQIFINIRGQAKRVPDTRGWDYIKRAMDDMIDTQTDPLTRKVTNEGRILVGLKNRMLKEIDAYNPDYKAARSAFSNVAQIDDALEFGRKAMTMSPEAAQRELSGFSLPQKQAARIGAAEELRKAIDGAGWTNNAVLKLMNGRQKMGVLRQLFDTPAQFAEFRKAIFNEVRRRKTYDAVRGNSTTAAQLADMFEAGGTNGAMDLAGKVGSGGIVRGTLEWVGSRLRRLGGLTPQVADQIAKRLMSTSPGQTRQLVSELQRIESARLSANQRAAMVQRLLSAVLTAQTTKASGS